MRCFVKTLPTYHYLWDITSYSVFPPQSLFIFMVHQIPRQGRASLGSSKPCVEGFRCPATSSCWVKELGLSHGTGGHWPWMLGGHRVLACLPLIARPSGLPSQRQSTPFTAFRPGDTACQTPQKEAEPEQVSKDKVDFMFFFTFQPCVLSWESGNKSF